MKIALALAALCAGAPLALPALASAAPPLTSTKGAELRLADLGYLPRAEADGVWTSRTTFATMALQGWEGLQIDGVIGPQTRRALARASRPTVSPGGRRIEVFRTKGVALLVGPGNRVIRAIHVSTARPGYSTPAGTFSVYRREQMSWSRPYSVWLPLASYFYAGYAFHEYSDVPGYPASHGCVRVPPGDSQIIWKFAQEGTRVHIS